MTFLCPKTQVEARRSLQLSGRKMFVGYSRLGRIMKKDLEAEIMRVKAELENQKKIIKKNVSKPLVIERAETEMRALHTRLAVLEANLAKL